MVEDNRTDADTDDDDNAFEQTEDRDEELSTRKGVKKALLDIYKDLEKGWEDQYERSNQQADYWDIYNCHLSSKQFYSGNSKIFVPIVYNAINARKTRFVNQIFPTSGRNVEVTTEDGTYPHAIMSLAEHYIRKAQLRTKVMPALVKCGDIEGQYNIYVSWAENKRHVVQRVRKPAKMEGFDLDDEEVEDIEEEEITHGYPVVEVLSDADVLVLPHTADSIEEAIESGGSVTILRRWTKAKVKREIEAGNIRESEGDSLIDQMTKDSRVDKVTNTPKKMTDAAGIKGEGAGKYALVYECWTKLTIRGERRICRTYFGGETQILGCKRNPNWSDHLPIISAPLEKVHGSFKGRSKVEPVADIQYQANDAVNEAMDSAAYALMPIVMTDPAKNPRIGSMILSMAAIWETSPNDTQFAQFPQLWKDGLEIASAARAEIMQGLGVDTSMITQQQQARPGSKQNQAQVAQEQQVALLNTADVVTVIEESILTPLLNRIVELDHQYRDDDLIVRQYGEMGQQAVLESIPPVQFNRRYQFRWFGVEAARSAQQVQQQIAGVNVLRGIPPELLNGYKLNLVPVVTQFVENTFGPRLAPLVFMSPEAQLPVPIDQEQMLLVHGYEVPIHELDDDKAHIQAHGQLMQFAQASENVGGGVVKKIQAHIFAHMQQMQKKQMAQQQQQMAAMGAGQPGAPGGAGKGMPGQPKPGAISSGPRGGQGPPGMIHQDRMQDPSAMPRKM